MKTFRIAIMSFLILSAISCAEMAYIMEQTQNRGLSEQEVVRGLKTALEVGADTAVAVTSETNGYYKDEAIKILLPPEADVVYDQKDNMLFRAVGLDRLIDKAVLSINRSAEDAASEAGPILKKAITSLSIAEAWKILNGKNPASGANQQEAFDSTAATGYLKSTTYDQLFEAFNPRINASLEKELAGNFSTKQIWDDLTTSYNKVARPLGMNTVETRLDHYVTEKALEGLFQKIALEEKEIRRDPSKWAGTAVEESLKKVFAKN